MNLKKRKFPNMFFPPLGVKLFLPPQEEDLKTIRDHKELSSKNLTKSRSRLLQKVLFFIYFVSSLEKAYATSQNAAGNFPSL